MRNLNGYRPSSPSTLMYGAHRFGQLGLPCLHDRIQAEKFSILQRTQETGGLGAIAVDNMLTRVAHHLAIPHIAQSPVTLGCLLPMDMKHLRLFAGSLAQYVSDRGCSLRKRGKEDWNTPNARVPRPTNGSHSDGSPGWMRKFDIQSISDLTTGVPDLPHEPAIWRTFPTHPHEPPWVLPLISQPPPEGPVRLRRGMLLYLGGPRAYEYLGFRTPTEIHVRIWEPTTTVTPERLTRGMTLRCCSNYHGHGGDMVVPAHVTSSASQLTFNMTGKSGQGQTMTVESFIFRKWELPWMSRISVMSIPWVEEIVDKLQTMRLMGQVTMHGDASYAQHRTDPTAFALPTDPEHAYIAGGIVIATQSPHWRRLPCLVVQIQNGQEMHMDNAFPMELLVLEMELLLTKRMGVHNTITSDCQSAITTVKHGMCEGTPSVPRRGQAHITNTCLPQLPRQDQCTLVKVKAHVERRQPDRSRWSEDEYGNFIADCAADPDWKETIRPPNPSAPTLLPQGEFLALDATTVLLSSMLPSTWNLYDSELRPTPWSFLRRQNESIRQRRYLADREHHSAHIQRHRQWTKREMTMAAQLWAYSKQTKQLQCYITRILYDQHWHGANRAKNHLLSEEEHAHQLCCELCGNMDGQDHIVGSCPHPAMSRARTSGLKLLTTHFQSSIDTSDPDLPESRRWVARVLLTWWQEKRLSIPARWIGIWSVDECTTFAEEVTAQSQLVEWTGKLIMKALTFLYRPVLATTVLLYKIRSPLLQERSVLHVPRAHPIIKDWFRHISIAASKIHHSPCCTPSSQGESQLAALPPDTPPPPQPL